MEKVERGHGQIAGETFTDRARAAVQVVTFPIGRFLARLGFHPNTITLLGALMGVSVAGVLAGGYLRIGGILLAITAPLDALDGALARVTGQRSDFGAFLDSTMDRVSEAALLIGLASYYLRQGSQVEVVLAMVGLASGMLVSYARARAEGAGYTCKVGVLTRLERIVVLSGSLILGLPTVGLWILAIGSSLTALHRILYVHYQEAGGRGQEER